MAHLKHGEHGTEMDVPDELADTFKVDGWEVTGNAGTDRPGGRRKSSRKAADD